MPWFISRYLLVFLVFSMPTTRSTGIHGETAFETARRLDRPILLSIGYSTCHWCHVMEAESFEDIVFLYYNVI